MIFSHFRIWVLEVVNITFLTFLLALYGMRSIYPIALYEFFLNISDEFTTFTGFS